MNSKSAPSSPLPISLLEIVNTSSIAYPLPALVIVTLVTSVSDVTTLAIAPLPEPPETVISVYVPAVAAILPVSFEILPNKASTSVFNKPLLFSHFHQHSTVKSLFTSSCQSKASSIRK